MDLDFDNMDFSSITGVQTQQTTDDPVPPVDPNIADKTVIGAPTDAVEKPSSVATTEDPSNDDAEDDWDAFVESNGVEEISEEEKKELELINKYSGDRKFSSIKEYQDYLNNPKKEEENNDPSNQKKELTVEEKIAEENLAISKFQELIGYDDEELLKMDIRREDPEIDDEDMELELEALKNSGMFYSKVRSLKGLLKRQIDARKENIGKIQQEEQAKQEEKQVNARKALKNVLKNRNKLFDAIDINEDINKAAYKRIVSGEFHESLKGNHSEIAKLATLQLMEEQIIKAFKSLKQSGHAFESGKLSILNKAANVKPRTQSGSNPLDALFDEPSGMNLKDISMDGMTFVEDNK